ncbi:hypothetical protein XavaCFBP5823_06870 [Xanthomonas axonopodis pv. vasculorum]|nr:hypothetical protein XavaCFBP5823_06870 [Xanthomonas axonopodis pv. vasculorum]
MVFRGWCAGKSRCRRTASPLRCCAKGMCCRGVLPRLAGGLRCRNVSHQAYRMFSVSLLTALGHLGVLPRHMPRAHLAAARP